MFFRGEVILFCEFILQVFQGGIVQITVFPAHHTNQMIMVLASVFAFELFDPVSKIDFSAGPVFFDDLDGFINVLPAEIFAIQRIIFLLFGFGFDFFHNEPVRTVAFLLIRNLYRDRKFPSGVFAAKILCPAPGGNSILQYSYRTLRNVVRIDCR